MKYLVLSSISVCLFALHSNNSLAQSKSVQTIEQVPTTTVDFYQERAFGLFSLKHSVFANGKLVCKLKRNSHCRITVPTGLITFKVVAPLKLGHSYLNLNIEQGKVYYIRGNNEFILLPPKSLLVLTEVMLSPTKIQQINTFKILHPVNEGL